MEVILPDCIKNCFKCIYNENNETNVVETNEQYRVSFNEFVEITKIEDPLEMTNFLEVDYTEFQEILTEADGLNVQTQENNCL